jgi:hypothetical protein
MTTLAVLILSLMAVQLGLRGRARLRARRNLRPAAEWTGEDVRRWLELIEPFPLGREEPEQTL